MVFRYVIALCLVGAVLADYCFDKKCRNFDGSHITCDQEKYYCREGTQRSAAKCGSATGKTVSTHLRKFTKN